MQQGRKGGHPIGMWILLGLLVIVILHFYGITPALLATLVALALIVLKHLMDARKA